MIVISGSVRIAEPSWNEALAGAEAMMVRSRLEPGCVSYEFSTSLSERLCLRLFEEWTDEQALAAHFATDSFKAFSRALRGWEFERPALKRYDNAYPGPLFSSSAPAPQDTNPGGESPNDRLGPVATGMLFENELVRVWEMRLAPGEMSARHRHDHPYLMCIVEGQSIGVDRPDGSPIDFSVAPGDVLFVPSGRTERAVNRSSGAFHEILIELKHANRQGLKLQRFSRTVGVSPS